MPHAGVRLRLVVVDDQAIAAAIRRLKDQWNAETGAELEVAETSEEDAASASGLSGDAIICPGHLLGPWAEAGRLAPVPRSISRDTAGPWSETFPLLRNHEAAWGNEVYGVPLGSPVLCCYYRADLLEKLGRRPPRTWTEYAELARLLQKAGADSGVNHGTVEPLGPGWAGLVLLARAAAYAKQRDDYTTLFDETTFEPMIDGPPFVRALEDLVEAAKLGPAESLGFDPAAVRNEFWSGRAAMAVSWPTAAKDGEATESAGPPSGVIAGFSELPGATDVYRNSTRTWEPRSGDAGAQVPLLGISGRIGVVRAGSEQAEAAFRFLLWLTEPRWSGEVFAASSATTLFRTTQVDAAKRWVDRDVTATAARQYAQQTARALSRPQFLASLRIPGRARYLAALDEAVHAVVRGRQSPAAALKAVAARWREISKELGLERQRTAYMHSLGL
jgi:multiple sugar transport system substrate-binding protein